jgi:hypothetical protein
MILEQNPRGMSDLTRVHITASPDMPGVLLKPVSDEEIWNIIYCGIIAAAHLDKDREVNVASNLTVFSACSLGIYKS